MTAVVSLQASAETATQHTWCPLVTRILLSGSGCSQPSLPPAPFCSGVTRQLMAKGRVGTEGGMAFLRVLLGRPGHSVGAFSASLLHAPHPRL